ncbi:MAG: TetR/AcrR family transcriptional regulator [Nocardioides sp.]|nr:TetR/AcrR family transcriptional regulator [Nocardioides sp.]
MKMEGAEVSAPLTARGASTRERILQSGAVVLAENGYSGTTLVDIAARAKTKAGSLYYYFASREDLIREIMTRGITETHAYVAHAVDSLPPGATSRDRLAAAIVEQVRYLLKENDIARASIRTLGQAPPEVEGPAIELHRVYGRYVAALIDAACEDGYIDPRTDGRVLRLLIMGAANWSTAWYNPKGSASVDEIAETLVRMAVTDTPVHRPEEPPARRRRRRPVAD